MSNLANKLKELSNDLYSLSLKVETKEATDAYLLAKIFCVNDWLKAIGYGISTRLLNKAVEKEGIEDE